MWRMWIVSGHSGASISGIDVGNFQEVPVRRGVPMLPVDGARLLVLVPVEARFDLVAAMSTVAFRGMELIGDSWSPREGARVRGVAGRSVLDVGNVIDNIRETVLVSAAAT